LGSRPADHPAEYHYGKHHKTYVDNLNTLVAGKPEERLSLEAIIRSAEAGSPLFNNAAQAWNHAFYWNSMRPGGGGAPRGALLDAVQRDFGSVENVRAELASAATAHFGSASSGPAAPRLGLGHDHAAIGDEAKPQSKMRSGRRADQQLPTSRKLRAHLKRAIPLRVYASML
jgi:hypothetical protein